MDFEFMNKVSEDIQTQKDFEQAEANRKAMEDYENTQIAYTFIYFSIIFVACFAALQIIEKVF